LGQIRANLRAKYINSKTPVITDITRLFFIIKGKRGIFSIYIYFIILIYLYLKYIALFALTLVITGFFTPFLCP